MDARRTSRLAWLMVSLASLRQIGCSELQNPGAAPDSRRDPPASSSEPAMIVKDTERSKDGSNHPAEPDSFGNVVLEYIKRIDQAEAQKKAPTANAAAKPVGEKSQMIFDPAAQPDAATEVSPPRDAKTVLDDSPSQQPKAATSSANAEAAAVLPPAVEPHPAPQPSRSADAPAQAPAAGAARPAAIIRPAPRVQSVADAPENDKASINGSVTARNAPHSLREYVAQLTASPADDAPFSEQLDFRILMALAGEVERAREPLPMASREQAEISARYIESLIAIREGHLGDPTAAATAALREIDRLADALRQSSNPSVPVLEICREVRAFGQYSPIVPREFRTGSPAEFVLYCEVRDFMTRKIDDGQLEARFELTTTIFDNSGGEVLRFEDRDLIDRCRTRRRDCFIPRLIRLPATLAPGPYVAKITLVDKLGDKVVEAKTDFRITAR
ncbi:MAG: hypothetical protein JNG88_05965 [Phycisphaerales bacterium]|nr:hypothetical protein [Phycisphaerales bacterium]